MYSQKKNEANSQNALKFDAPSTSQNTPLLQEDAHQQADVSVGSAINSELDTSKAESWNTGTTDGPWSPAAQLAALILFLGTTFSTLLNLHVSNDIPDYFFAIAVFIPISGLLFYPVVVCSCHITGLVPAGLSRLNILPTLKWGTLIGFFFAMSNILRDYGISGQSSGTPDVSAAYSLILMKLVVPVSLFIEFALARKLPLINQVAGVAILMGGIVITALTYRTDASNKHSEDYEFKVLCLILSTVPLALGFWVVKQARAALPKVTAFELWMILCLPEALFSVGLSYIGQMLQDKGTYIDGSMSASLANGLACLVIGRVPASHSSIPCLDAAIFTWVGLIPGYAFNLAIPVLIHLRGSTSVPLFRALALPAASLLAMSGYDAVIATKFTWEGVLGMLLAVIGLFLYNKPCPVSGQQSIRNL